MKVYPIMLKVARRRAVVVGGGPVAARKVRLLKDAGAQVTVVAESVADDAALRDVELIRRPYRPEDLRGAAIVCACTDDRALNARIAADARRAGALVNCADQPEDCDFFTPAVVSDGEVIVAIGTGGTAPSLTGLLKERIAGALPARIGEFAAALAKLREKVKTDVGDSHRRGGIMRKLSGPESYEAFRTGGEEALGKILKDLLP